MSNAVICTSPWARPIHMNVLIVDDHVAHRVSLQRLLRDRGLTGSEAADGHEGLAVLKSGTRPVHAIISDILMPRMDGYRFCFEVRRLPQFHEIPFIFYSSTHTSPSDEKLGLQLGANAFLSGVETACFRVAQEAVTNIRRHAGARQATLSLSESAGALRLRVSDDGAGFDVAAACRRAHSGGSFGLLGMQERVALVGGQLEFNSKPGQGTELRAHFPLAPLQPGTGAAWP